ncbi:hypothetical protein AB0C33_01960 [Nonomuraea sp. NPDC048881]|uniref:hypothetical protein n=1 Tax=Nonomuraea sp. NPDC048881 TaxID=3155030 RepID=UPI0033DDAAF1
MRYGGDLRKGDMPQINIGDVLEFRIGDFEVLDWAHKPGSARLAEPEQYLLLLKDRYSSGLNHHVAYLGHKEWRQGETCRPTVQIYTEEQARRIFHEKAERNNFAVRSR